MDKKKLTIIAVIIVAIVAIGAYFATSAGSDTIKIGHLPSDHDSALFVAKAQNQFESQGLKVETVQFNNGGDLMTAIASGDIDIGYAGITPVLSSIEKGVPVKVVSGAQTEGSGVVVAKNSGITSFDDLKGKNVATPGEATIQNMLLTYALKKEGINTKGIEFTAMKAAQMNDALKAGKIDAMITWEPYSSIAVNNGYGELLANTSQILPGHPCCVVVAREDFINNHPDELKKILAIHKNATDFVNKNPSEAAKLLPEDIVPDKGLQATVLDDTNFVSGLDDSYKENVLKFVDIEVELGLLQKAISSDKIFADI